MRQELFLENLQDILQLDNAISLNDKLSDYHEWDSLSKIALFSFYDRGLGVKVSMSDISLAKTVQDLLDLAKL